jgi:hypothetical protein
MNPPHLDTHWNNKRAEATHKVKKAGTSAFLLFNDAELAMLREQIDAALGGHQWFCSNLIQRRWACSRQSIKAAYG